MEEVKTVEEVVKDTDKIFAFLSYFLFFGVLIYKTQKDSDYVHYHSKQGMILFGFNLIGNLVLLVLPIIGWLLMFFLNLTVFILFIIGAINALNGNKVELPIIGKFANIIK